MRGKEKNMKKDMDKIQFESRREIEAIMDVIAKYIEQNPSEKENVTLNELYNYLDVMHLSW